MAKKNTSETENQSVLDAMDAPLAAETGYPDEPQWTEAETGGPDEQQRAEAVPEATPEASVVEPEPESLFCAVEEHAAALKVSAPVFAAVKQAQGWAEGKKTKRADFEEAVKGFLNGSMGGFKNGFTGR